MKKAYSRISPENLRKTLFLYLASSLFIFSLFLTLTIANPIYERLKISENNSVYHKVELTAMAVNEWVRRAMDIAVQVTSRTRIRQELEKYNHQQITLTQLKTFTEPKLSDAMNMSAEVIGITRLDSLGKIVAQCGEYLPPLARSIDYSAPFDTSISAPVIQNGRHVVIVSAPIINRSKQYTGADLVVIDLYQLKNIINSKTEPGKTHEMIMGYISNGKISKTFFETKTIKNDVINDLLKKACLGREGIDDKSPVFVAAYHGLDIKNFGLVILKNKTELYSTLNTRLIYWSLTGILAYIVFLTGFWFLMKPLADNLLLHSDELSKKVKEQTRHLEEEITERKRTERALRESESKFRSIFDNKGTATCLFGKDKIIRECNPTFIELSGYLRADIINKMKWSDFTEKEDVEKMRKHRDQHLKETGFGPSQYESRLINKKGEIKTVIINISLIGENRIVSLTDITERKLAETENQNLHKKLAQAQKMEAMGSLAGGIAHDFNNILSAIIGFTELAKMDMVDDNGKRIKHLNRVLVAANRAKDLVHQILTFSRQTEQEVRPLKLEPIIKEVLQLIRASLPSTIEIQSDISNDSLIMGDRIHIHQVILNLCTNAGHAMQNNGGTLYVSLTNQRIGPGSTANAPDLSMGDYVKVQVRDTGHGIAPELIERLFEPFFTTKDPGEGTGMGLAVVHGIVQNMKGEVVVESSLGKGSSFSVYLPVVQDMEPTDEPEENTLAKGCGHILFVDDELALVDIAELLLKELGYSVTTKTSGIEALNAFKSSPDKFDLVLTDMTMPRMTGERLAKEIIAIRKETPIIITTGFSSAMTEKKALELGVKGLLRKPFVLSELARVIHNVLDDDSQVI